jgi:hypothetical protein
MSTNKIAGWLAATGLLLITTLTSSAAYAVLIPGIIDPSIPAFSHSAKIRTNKGVWTGATNNGHKDLTFTTSSGAYIGEIFKFNFTATFNDAGVFQSGSMSIQGSIAALGITDKKTVLVSADLISFNDNGQLAGFNTDNIVCNSTLEMMTGLTCTTSESVIFTFAGTYPGDPAAKFNATASSVITSVPIPAAVWLFGSGLGLIGAVARRRKEH